MTEVYRSIRAPYFEGKIEDVEVKAYFENNQGGLQLPYDLSFEVRKRYELEQPDGRTIGVRHIRRTGPIGGTCIEACIYLGLGLNLGPKVMSQINAQRREKTDHKSIGRRLKEVILFSRR